VGEGRAYTLPMARALASPLLVAAALASGAAALTLELQWSRQLALVFGASHYAAATVLAAFMAGLGIGSWLGGRRADGLRSPAMAVAMLELSLAGLGPVMAVILHALPAVSAAVLPDVGVDGGAAFLGSRFGVAALLLVPPTVLMGATFPLLVRAFTASLETLHRGVGVLYAANTLGGVVGVTMAGLVVLPAAGVVGTTVLAAAANLTAAVCALVAARGPVNEPTQKTRRSKAPTIPRRLLWASGVSGGLVLGAETVWHRALMLVLTNTTITLTVLLGLTLLGLGLGGALSGRLPKAADPLRWWAGLQLTAAVLVAAQSLWLPELATLVREIRPDMGWGRVLVPILSAGGLLILPVTVVLGAAWPLLLRAVLPAVDDGGARVGRMGLVNALGAGAGAAVVGFGVLPALGFGRSLLVLAAAHAGLAWVGSSGERGMARTVARVVTIGAAVAAALLPPFATVPLPSLARGDSGVSVLEYTETASGVVVVTEHEASGMRGMYVDNNAVIGTTYDALKVTRMLGLLPVLVHSEPAEVLVIGFGAGVTSATAAATPGVERMDVVEIVPGVAEAARHFADVNHRVWEDPRVRLVRNDGRNHLLLTDQRYDVITCDPVHPLYGSAALYSVEFFELGRSRLHPGGIMAQYLPLHRMPAEDFARAVAGFQTVFPETWLLFGLGHAMLLGSDEPIVLDWNRWRTVLESHPLRADLQTSNLGHVGQIAVLFHLDPANCREFGRGTPSTDLHPRLEFLAPAAYEPGVYQANARALVEASAAPLDRIVNLPPDVRPHLERLVAGKRLLLFSLLDRNDGDLDGAAHWLSRAMQIAPDDPEVVQYGRQLALERRAAARASN
jgi:spermidine synthase